MALAQGTELASHRTIRRSTRSKEDAAEKRSSASRGMRCEVLDAIFKALADSTRREILRLLIDRPLAVHEIVGHFHLTQPSISRHLAILRTAGLVLHERHGQRVIYRLGDAELLEITTGFLDTLAGPAAHRNAI